MDFCSITYGERLLGMAPPIFFGMRRHPNPTLCPIKGIIIETCVAIAQELGISLSSGYLFRATNQQGHIVDKPLLSSTAESRLKKYLRDAHIYNGETLRSFRSGCAVTLALSGSPRNTLCSSIIPVWPPDLHTSIGVRVRSL